MTELFDLDYFERGAFRTSREMTTATYRNLLVRWLASRRPALLEGEGRRALEVGCGYGYVTSMLAELGYDAIGTDVSAHAIERAARECASERARFAVWDATTPSPFEGRFELIVALEVIEHLVDPDDAIAGWAAMLAPGGALVCTTPNRNGPASRYWRDPTHVSVRGEGAWRAAVQATARWEAVEVDAVQFVPGLWRLRREMRFFALPRVGSQLRILATAPSAPR